MLFFTWKYIFPGIILLWMHTVSSNIQTSPPLQNLSASQFVTSVNPWANLYHNIYYSNFSSSLISFLKQRFLFLFLFLIFLFCLAHLCQECLVLNKRDGDHDDLHDNDNEDKADGDVASRDEFATTISFFYQSLATVTFFSLNQTSLFLLQAYALAMPQHRTHLPPELCTTSFFSLVSAQISPPQSGLLWASHLK